MKSFGKILFLVLFPFILVCCNNDDDPVDQFTPPTISFEIDGSEVVMNNFYAVKNNDRLVIVMENDSNKRLEIKFKDLADGTQGFYLLSQISTVNFFDGSNNTAYSSKTGNAFFTGDSIFIENYNINQKIISASFNGSLYDSPSNNILIENVDFELQFEENLLQDSYSASLNGGLLNSDSILFETEYADGHINVWKNDNDGSIIFFFPLDVETGEYNFSPLAVQITNSFIPIGGLVYVDGIDPFTLSATTNIEIHSPTERRIKGNVVVENSDNIITVEFDGFYF